MTSIFDVAEEALTRGEYSKCLEILEPLSQKFSINDDKGAKTRMLMVTALMGKGEEDKAIILCRLLSKCQEPISKSNAKQLLSILDAPALKRPSNWSIELPVLNVNSEQTNIKLKTFHKGERSFKATKKIYPPTGTTKTPEIGFTIFVSAILLFITILIR